MNAQLNPRELGGTLLRAEPMRKHTSWRVGGPADCLYKPASIDDLADFLRALDDEMPVYWFGLGSNLLVRDGGIRGAVISTMAMLNRLTRIEPDLVEAQAGVACTRMARSCVRWQLGPAAFFAGIPGTVGGALSMNAGAFGGETWDNVVDVDLLGRDGERRRRDKSEYRIGYRSVSGPENEWFLAARFRLQADERTDMSALRELTAQRKATQPIGLPSCGSVFRNPPGDHAARLIETAGLKGHRIGDAVISDKHANFIINLGGAMAVDVEALIEHVMAEVEACHGVRLQTEVRIVGEAA